MTHEEFSSLGLQPGTDVVLTLLDGTRKYVRYTGLRLINALDPDPDKQMDPLFMEAPGRTFGLPLENIDDIEMPPLRKRIIARLRKVLDGGKPGDTVKVMDAAEDPHGMETGAKEDLFATVAAYGGRKAVLIHGDIAGRRTRARLIPEEHFKPLTSFGWGFCAAEEDLIDFFYSR